MSNYIFVNVALDFDERYPDASAIATECAMNLVRTADLLEKCIASLLADFDLSPASGLVLSILADSDTPLAPNVIADHLIISRASVTSLLDSLEKRGYVSRLCSNETNRIGDFLAAHWFLFCYRRVFPFRKQ
jgi:predicted transcriptional regulator